MKRESITERLREIRSRFGLSQPEIADKIGVTERMYASAEEGTTPPGYKLLTGLHDALGVSADYILHGKGNPFVLDTESSDGAAIADIFGRYKAIIDYLTKSMNYNFAELAKELNTSQDRIRRLTQGVMPQNGGAYYELVKLERTFGYRIAYAREAKKVYGLEDRTDISTLYRTVIERIRDAGNYESLRDISEHLKIEHNQMYPRYKKTVKARIEEVEYLCDFAASKLGLPRVAPVVFPKPEYYTQSVEEVEEMQAVDDAPILFPDPQPTENVELDLSHQIQEILPEVKAMIRDEIAKINHQAPSNTRPVATAKPSSPEDDEAYQRKLRETQDLALRFIERKMDEEIEVLKTKFGYKKDI